MSAWSNWVGNQSFTPQAVVPVADEAQVQAQVAKAVGAGFRVRTFGTGHSFTPIVETDVLLDASSMRGITHIDVDCQQVSAGPKTTIRDFGEPLWEHGLALANQGDIDTQAIAGVVATATHGSGRRLGSFSSVLTGARLVDGQANVIDISATSHSDLLPALQTSVGLLGIMTELTISVVPAYELHARTDVMPFDEMIESFSSDVSEFRHYGFFWMPTEDSARLYNLEGAGADDCVVKRYHEVPVGTSREGLGPHERVGRSYQIYPMVYDPNFHEVEYFLPIEDAEEILRSMRQLMLRWLPLSLYPLEIRVVGSEQAWMSPNYQRDNLVVSISGEPGKDYWPYLSACDDLFAEFGGRPHWGKLHFMTRERVASLFPRFNDFVSVRRRLDPAGTFLNDHLGALFA
ncbi:MAG TPA: D-arabinono-1,4-lactone oxidase [Acidimicrobiia bacterium]|nr:D-arabinono-1,4-lactone oxidase [Acidimicrobiia bacterium]